MFFQIFEAIGDYTDKVYTQMILLLICIFNMISAENIFNAIQNETEPALWRFISLFLIQIGYIFVQRVKKANMIVMATVFFNVGIAAVLLSIALHLNA